MFTSISRIKSNSNLSSAAQSIRKSRKSNNQSSLNGNLNIQAKLTVGQPNDKYEQEADRVADQVMSIPANDTVQRSCSSCMAEENPLNTKSLSTSISPLVQMQPVEEEEEVLQPKLLLQSQPIEEEEEELQPKRIQKEGWRGSAEASSGIESKINQSRGSGQPLQSNTRSFMESHFGSDFGSVKVHSDSTSVQMNRELKSQAFTVGNNIFFNSGHYNPGSSKGKHLLSHELTHVLQQNGDGTAIQKEDEEDRHETETEAPLPSPDANVGSVDVGNNAQLNSTLSSSPQLIQDLSALDPSRFNIYISPLSTQTSIGPLAPINPTSGLRIFPNIPSQLQSTTTPGVSVPSEFSLFSKGPFHFRIVFEEPSLNTSEALRESEQRFSQFVNPPSPGIDTGKLIKGLITNFLTQTPPGQSILQGVTGAFSSGSEEGEPVPTTNLNLDILPSPILKGQLPGVMLNVQGSF